MCIPSEIVTNVSTYNLKHVTLSTGLLLIVRRWTFVGSTKNHFFCPVAVNDHTVVCRPGEEVIQVLQHSNIWADSFPFSRVSVRVVSSMNLCTTH